MYEFIYIKPNYENEYSPKFIDYIKDLIVTDKLDKNQDKINILLSRLQDYLNDNGIKFQYNPNNGVKIPFDTIDINQMLNNIKNGIYTNMEEKLRNKTLSTIFLSIHRYIIEG